MYQLNTKQFCTDFAKLIMEGDTPVQNVDFDSQIAKSINNYNSQHNSGDNNGEEEENENVEENES